MMIQKFITQKTWKSIESIQRRLNQRRSRLATSKRPKKVIMCSTLKYPTKYNAETENGRPKLSMSKKASCLKMHLHLWH
jgi:hypothetical protein